AGWTVFKLNNNLPTMLIKMNKGGNVIQWIVYQEDGTFKLAKGSSHDPTIFHQLDTQAHIALHVVGDPEKQKNLCMLPSFAAVYEQDVRAREHLSNSKIGRS